ncbi:hypothetical protein [Parapedobacter koreensis]|uniref:Uncharacterized protein n=1 Tax=Parapedobacter koreensis TaxID=332977 RepID=A0A1H7K1C9_9SPHI|nr:hypothetical protein [Parapedobacter koreensis]SEK80663.1 hypothetical protein SAMN05421740_102750 [Parapedobacter koreensis]
MKVKAIFARISASGTFAVVNGAQRYRMVPVVHKKVTVFVAACALLLRNLASRNILIMKRMIAPCPATGA